VLSSLIALCPPPSPAVRVDWARAEGLLGLALPDDYKALAEAYGVGWFSEWLMADLPDSLYPQFDLLHDVQETVEWHRSGRDQQPGTILYAFHLEPSGLIPWGHTRTGEVFWWLPVTDDPASWRIVVSSSGAEQWTEFDSTTTGFVHAVLTRQLQLPADSVVHIDEGPFSPPQFSPMPPPNYSDWDPRAMRLLRPLAPVATRDGWQAIIRAHAAGHAGAGARAQTHPEVLFSVLFRPGFLDRKGHQTRPPLRGHRARRRDQRMAMTV
jgi:hypothetical protein